MSDPQQHPIIVQSPGVVSVAADTIGALRGTPILLVMVLLNCAFLGAAVYYFRAQQENVARLVDKMLERCLPDGPSHYAPPKRPYVPTPEESRP